MLSSTEVRVGRTALRSIEHAPSGQEPAAGSMRDLTDNQAEHPD
jgi:hypothetical protein